MIYIKPKINGVESYKGQPQCIMWTSPNVLYMNLCWEHIYLPVDGPLRKWGSEYISVWIKNIPYFSIVLWLVSVKISSNDWIILLNEAPILSELLIIWFIKFSDGIYSSGLSLAGIECLLNVAIGCSILLFFYNILLFY